MRADRPRELVVDLVQIDPERAVARIASDAVTVELTFGDQVPSLADACSGARR